MKTYYFDDAGWLSLEPIKGRETQIEPPATQAGMRANWSGFKWLLTPYEMAAAAAEKVPQSVSMRQARLALLSVGMLDAVNAGIASMPQAAQIEWEFASEVRRDSPLIALMAGQLGLDIASLDALFLAASEL